MAAAYNPDKAPPPLADCATYEDYKKLVTIWSEFTTLDKNKQGMAVFLSLKGADQEAVLELPTDQIKGEHGLNNVLARLDKLYVKDETLEKYKALEDFESYRRSAQTPINEFILQFEKKYHRIKSYGTVISDDLLAFRLLKSANLPTADEKLAKGTAALKFDPMKEQLKKLFSESNSLGNSITAHHIEEINLAEQPEYESAYFTRNRSYPRGRSNTTSYPPRGHNRIDCRQPSTQYTTRRSTKPPMNPRDDKGNITTCTICQSIMHWANQCPHRSSSGSNTLLTSDHTDIEHSSDQSAPDNITDYITLFQADLDTPQQLTGLVAESLNCAVLDCGASKTVCGAKWFDILYESLSPEQQNEIKYSSSNRVFKFGDGNQVK